MAHIGEKYGPYYPVIWPILLCNMTHIAFEDYAADEWGGVGVWQKAYGGQGSGYEEAGGLA